MNTGKSIRFRSMVTSLLSVIMILNIVFCNIAFAENDTNIIASWEGEDAASGTWTNSWTKAVCTYDAEAKVQKISYSKDSSGNPHVFFTLANPISGANKITKMLVSMKTNQDVNLKLYYVTGTELKGFKEAMSTTLLSFEKGDFKEYEFEVNSDTFAGFADNMQAFRLTVSKAADSPTVDFETGLELEFKYIRFVETEESQPGGPSVPDEPDVPAVGWPVSEQEEPGFEGRSVVYGVEMNDRSVFNDWGQGLNYPADIVDGAAKFKITNKSNMSYGKVEGNSVLRNKVTKVAVKLRPSSTITPQVYFSGTNEAIDSTRMLTLPIVAASEDFKVVSVDTSSNENWGKGTDLTRYRLSFSGAEAGDVVEVDWVRFYTDIIPEYTETVKSISYDFDGTNYGFEKVGNISDVVAYNGELWSKVTGAEDGIQTKTSSSYEASEVKRIDVKYQNGTSGSVGKIYFTTDTCKEYCEECSFSFTVSPNESGVYKINTCGNEKWKGKITGIRLIPTNAAGDIKIDYIRLNKLQCSVEPQIGNVKVGGNLYGISGKSVNITVKKGTESLYTNSVITNDNGVFSFDFEIPGATEETAVYNAFFSSEEFDGEYMVSFVYAPKIYIDSIIEQINEAKAESDSTAFKSLIQNNYSLFNNSDYYVDFVSENQHIDEMFGVLEKNEQPLTKENLGEQLDDAIVKTDMMHMTGEEWHASIDKYQKQLKFNEHSEYKIYQNAVDEENDNYIQKEIASKIGTHTDYVTARKAFDEQTVLVSLKYAVAWGDVKFILENISTENAAIDFTAVNRLKNPSGAYSLLAEGNFTSFAAVKTAFDNAVTQQAAKERETFQGGGGGNNVNSYSGGFSPDVDMSQPTNQNTGVSHSFSDMSGHAWASDAVSALYKRNIISGTGAGIFEPERQVTREEFVKMLVMQFELPLSEDVVFSDVEKEKWYAPYISAAVKQGFVAGQGDVFGVGQALTRQDAAVMINRIMGYGESGTDTTFLDNDSISDYAKSAVFNLNQKGIINGYGNGSFAPQNYLSRAEAAVLLNNLLERRD